MKKFENKSGPFTALELIIIAGLITAAIMIASFQKRVEALDPDKYSKNALYKLLIADDPEQFIKLTPEAINCIRHNNCNEH